MAGEQRDPFREDMTCNRDHVVWTWVTPGQMLPGNARGSRRLLCKLCNKEYSGNRKRAWEHFILARVSDRCPHSNLSIWRRLHGIGVQLPPDLHERVQRMLEMEKSDEEDTPVAGGGEWGEGGIAEDPGRHLVGIPGRLTSLRMRGRGGACTRGPTKQMSIRRFAKNLRHEDIYDSCCEFFVENAIPFNAARSRSFKKFMLTCIGPRPVGSHPLVPTGYNPLSYRLLDRLNKRLMDEKQVVRDDWQVTGCTFITDGTTNICGRSLMNYILAGQSKPVFVKCEDVSEGDKDSVAVVAGWKWFFREWGVEKITTICTDSFAGNLSAARMLREDPEFRQIYWIPCTTHCMDLLMHDIGKKEWVDVIITKANKVVNFFRVHRWPRSQLRTQLLKYPGLDCTCLLQPAQTRFGTNYVMLQRLEFESVVERLIGKKGSSRFDDCMDQLASKDPGAGVERNWSTWALVQTKSRNKLPHQRTEKLVASHWSLRLKSKGEDGPTVAGGWLGLAADWEDEDLGGDMANVTEAADDIEAAGEGTASAVGNTNIRHDPAAPSTSRSAHRLVQVEEGGDEDEADEDDEDDVPDEEWVDERSDSDRSWTRREGIVPYVQGTRSGLRSHTRARPEGQREQVEERQGWPEPRELHDRDEQPAEEQQ
ncbi:hypothetical protein CBR_g48570 [Chara braunii]|uniref:DUF659 domain-containing protein n=1 Tax=Chara braunii TaxID=69332 RepID=A0A388M302_CHABU|nr:hypothetical protein CBR_g48570 [Chara braunii]|eukprot:GBG88960.1 hypothetical protein CBR_g48570 [Chara braunii]